MKNQKQRLYCRGEKRRIQICKDYKIIPKGHFRILKGVTIRSDAGDDLTYEYFIFELISNKDSNDIYSIFCGSHAAHSFEKLADIDLPPIFNPLKEVNRDSTQNRKINKNIPKKNASPWNKERKQLLDIVLLTLSWLGEIDTTKPLFDIKTKLEDPKYIGYYPKKYLQRVNTILKNLHTTFEDIYEDLSRNNDLRTFSYDELLNYMDKNGTDNYITKRS